MTKLQFKTEGGFRRLADFDAHTDTVTDATGTYWHNPAALMEALAAASAREIRIPTGYKELADALDRLDFDKREGIFGRASEVCGDYFEGKAFDLMLHAAGGHTPALRAGNSGDEFGQLLAVATLTTVSGYTREAPHTPRTPVPGFPQFSRMALYAQSVAPQAGWFSRT